MSSAILEKVKKRIRGIYLVKFGNLYIHSKDEKIPEVEHCYSVRPWVGVPQKGKPPPFGMEQLISCFEKYPQVEKVTFVGGKKKQQIEWIVCFFDPHIHYHFKPVLKLNLNIPFKNQEFARSEKERTGDHVEPLTKFTVFYNGSNYLITAKVRDITKRHIVVDVRELLFDMLNERFAVESTPPNPMRENFYFIFLSDVKEMNVPKIIVKRNDVIIFRKDSKNKDIIFSNLLLDSDPFLEVFYAGSMIAQNLRSKYIELLKLHMDMQERDKELLTIPTHSFFKRRKIRKTIERLILDHYRIILDFYVCSNLIQEAKLSVKELSMSLPHFSKIVDRMIKADFEYYPLDINLYNACLQYTKEIMERSFSWRLAIYAAIFGTISSLLVNYGKDIINFLKGLLG